MNKSFWLSSKGGLTIVFWDGLGGISDLFLVTKNIGRQNTAHKKYLNK